MISPPARAVPDFCSRNPREGERRDPRASLSREDGRASFLLVSGTCLVKEVWSFGPRKHERLASLCDHVHMQCTVSLPEAFLLLPCGQ
ncbi:hypothetical protein MUG91_G43n9 [Manis pentadactyla]|nr:hypothetical protein MUG91_G43n9 [Manis pentadactyla]